MSCYNCNEKVMEYKTLKYYEKEFDDFIFERFFVGGEKLCLECYDKLKESNKHTIEVA